MTALALAGVLASTTALADPSAGAQIDEAVGRYLDERVQALAQREGWRDVRAAHSVDRPDSVTRLPACPTPPRVRPSGEIPEASERQRLEVVCPGESGWTVAVIGQPTLSLPAAHAATVIERGETIGPQHLTFEPINPTKAHRGFYNQPQSVIGQAAKRRIRASQLIAPNLLTAALAVQRGQPVKIIARHDGIEASVNGEALADGQPGDVIRVRNLSSEKVIDAQVVEPGVVTSTY